MTTDDLSTLTPDALLALATAQAETIDALRAELARQDVLYEHGSADAQLAIVHHALNLAQDSLYLLHKRDARYAGVNAAVFAMHCEMAEVVATWQEIEMPMKEGVAEGG